MIEYSLGSRMAHVVALSCGSVSEPTDMDTEQGLDILYVDLHDWIAMTIAS